MASKKAKTQYQHSVSVLKHNILDDIINACRVCMKVRKNMRNLFQSENKLIEEIHFCTGIRIAENASLSTSICQNCELELITAHKFKKKVLNSFTYEVFQIKAKLSGDDKWLVKVDKVVKNKSEVGDTENDMSGAIIGCDTNKNYDTKTDTDIDDMISDVEIEDSKDIIPVDEDAESVLIVKNDIVTEKRNIKHGKDTQPTRVLPATRSCMYCDKTFRTMPLLAAHKRECHKEQGHICDICGQTLKNQSSLNSHIKLHSAPQFSCSHCDYKTHTKKTLSNHLTVHNGEKKFICSQCNARFRLSTNLQSHVRIMHLKLKTHFCTKCDASFFGSTKLKRHLDSHDNIKRYECEVCQSCFTRRCHWKIHLLKQHNISTPPIKRGRQKTLLV